jgi:DNA-binding MarR family transcriptional regulator
MYEGRRVRRAKQRCEVPELDDYARIVDCGPGERAGPVEVDKALWYAAMRWRRGVEALTTPAGLTFTQWLVLDAIRELFDETEDASIQNEIASWIELDRTTVSQVVRRLLQKGLVDRDVDYRGKAWRVYVTDCGATLLAELYPRIKLASTRWR